MADAKPGPILSEKVKSSLRSSIGASLAILIALLFNWPYPHWAGITVIVLLAPSLEVGVALLPLRLAGVASGASLAFVIVATCGQDRTSLLLACSTVLFIVGVGVSSAALGPFFTMMGIAFPAATFFGISNFDNAIVTAFYRFAAASLGVLVFTLSHLFILPNRPFPAVTRTTSSAPLLLSFFRLPKSRWISGFRCAIGCAIAIAIWYQVEVPGQYGEVLVVCVLLSVCSSMPNPPILIALAGTACALAASFIVNCLFWAMILPGPEVLVLTVAPVLFVFALIQSSGPPYGLFGVFGGVIFLIALNVTRSQSFDFAAVLNKDLGLMLGGIVAAFVLRLFWPAPQSDEIALQFY